MNGRNKPLIKYFLIILFFTLLLGGIFLFKKTSQKNPLEKEMAIEKNKLGAETESKAEEENSIINIPLEDALSRITKKPFGIYISPENSPVQPEKFLGYHTGTDFEIKTDEENQQISIKTICSGELIFKGNVNGYGEVAVQKCEIQEQPVTVIYGHLDLKSIEDEGVFLGKGTGLGLLGEGFSPETDGERKHLHLGIHKGTEINFLGYVENPELLENWIDPVLIIK